MDTKCYAIHIVQRNIQFDQNIALNIEIIFNAIKIYLALNIKIKNECYILVE